MTDTQICNRALQKLGAGRITSLDEASPRAEDCKTLYFDLRDAELRKHPWKFALARATLAPDTATPAFEFSYQFTLPSDFLRMHPAHTYQEETDWTIEGRRLLTNDGDTIQFRYVRIIEDTSLMDPLFREALSCMIAHELAEPVTKGLNRKRVLMDEYGKIIAKAKAVDAIEKLSALPPTDDWVAVMQAPLSRTIRGFF